VLCFAVVMSCVIYIQFIVYQLYLLGLWSQIEIYIDLKILCSYEIRLRFVKYYVIDVVNI